MCFSSLNTFNGDEVGFSGWLSGKEPDCQCRRTEFDLGVRKIPWRRKCQYILMSLPGKSHREKPGRIQSMGVQRVTLL